MRQIGRFEAEGMEGLIDLRMAQVSSRRAPVDEVYMPNHNAEFALPALEAGSAFVPYIGTRLPDILCAQFERTVEKNNCVSFEGHSQSAAVGGKPDISIYSRHAFCRYAIGRHGVQRPF